MITLHLFFPFGNLVYSTSAELFKVKKKIFAPLVEPNICVNHVFIFSKRQCG